MIVIMVKEPASNSDSRLRVGYFAEIFTGAVGVVCY
jgi:hypothetical protein